MSKEKLTVDASLTLAETNIAGKADVTGGGNVVSTSTDIIGMQVDAIGGSWQHLTSLF